MKEIGYHCAVQEKGGTGVGGVGVLEAEGEGGEERDGEDEGEEGEGEEKGGAVAAAALTEAAATALLLGVAQTTLLLLPFLSWRGTCGPIEVRRARRLWRWTRVEVEVDVEE